ncbi:MAG: hypothetical protein NVS4B9_40660 [Ktedonobacteraceae bacterium]
MAYNSGRARWYLAEIVTEMRMAGEQENIVHNNLILIRASSAEEAYDKTVAHGRAMEETYQSPEGQTITILFRGLSDLNVIQDELEDGAEIAYEEMVDMSEEDIQEMLQPREDLGVFQPDEDATPEREYTPKDIVDEALRIINHKSDVE